MKKIREFIKEHWGVVSIIAMLVITISVFTLIGCQYYTDPQGIEQVKLTEDATTLLDKGAELAPIVRDTLIGVGGAFPVLGPILGIIAGAITALFGAYKKYRPQITREQTRAGNAESLTQALVFAIEQYKEGNSEDWEVLKLYLREQLADKVGPEALAVIETILNEYRNRNLFKEIE
jgi:hypothetical protein